MEESRIVVHPQFGSGKLLKSYMGGYEWEVLFDTGRRFRLPAREFAAESLSSWQSQLMPRGGFAPRIAVLEGDQYRARQTLEALRLGVVPVQDVETLTIGMEAERVSLERALSRSKERGGDVMAVIGDYGFGKSHFIEMAARHALREQFIVASTSLDLVEVPPAKAPEIYKALVQSLRYPDDDGQGLGPLLKKAVGMPQVVAHFVEHSPREQHDPLGAALQALSDCTNQRAYDDIVAWLSGLTRPTAELRTCLKRPPRIYTTGEVARQYSYLLSAISVLASLVGYSGLVVLIDESEHYSLLRANQRVRADAFFKAMICAALGPHNTRIEPTSIPFHSSVDYELAFASQPNLFFLFALTESENRLPVDSWLAPSQILRLDDRFIERDLLEFFKTLIRYHSIAYAYAYPPPEERYDDVVRRAPALLAKALSQHRINLREVIRLAVIVCDLLLLHPDYEPATLLRELEKGLRV